MPRQLLTVIYAGDVGVAEVRDCFNEVQTHLTNLKPGFRLLTDIAHLKSMDSSCTPYLKRMMDLCDEKGVGMVVRVISDPHRDIGFNIMSLFHYAPAVVIVTCSDWDEAERALKD